MNYLSCVSWGMYGGTSSAERANLLSSWGLMDSLPTASPGRWFYRGLSVIMMKLLRKEW